MVNKAQSFNKTEDKPVCSGWVSLEAWPELFLGEIATNIWVKLARILHFLHPILIIRALGLFILHPSCTHLAPQMGRLEYWR